MQGLSFVFRRHKIRSSEQIKADIQRAIMSVVVECMADMYASITQDAPAGVPVKTGQARGQFNKLAYQIDRLTGKYDLFDQHVSPSGNGPKAIEGKNAYTGEDLAQVAIQDAGATIRLSMILKVPYFEENDTDTPFTHEKVGQRDMPWEIMTEGGQAEKAFKESWERLSPRLRNLLVKDINKRMQSVVIKDDSISVSDLVNHRDVQESWE